MPIVSLAIIHCRERKIPIPLDDLEKFSDLVSFAKPTDSLASFLEIFQNVIEIFA